MGRPVGGASAVGCGVFGIGGLLVGVVLVFWLGSQTLSTSGSGSGSDGGPTGGAGEPSASAPVDDLGDLPDQTVLGMEPRGAAIAVAPASGFDDGTTVTITGSDLGPGPIDLTTCLTDVGSTTSVGGCDDSTTVQATVDSTGAFTLTYPVRRVITIDGTAYDCAARAGACSLFGHRPDNPLETGTPTTLAFATGLPPVDAIAPPAG